MLVKKKETASGTIRVKTKDLLAYEKTKTGWKRTGKEFKNLLDAVKLFKAEKRFKELIDKKDPSFLKGQLSCDGREQGARINILPNGEKLEKAYSLFAPHLKIHDQLSHDHWDVLYQNRGGTWSYVYTVEKRKQHRNKKYKKVEEFEKRYKKLVGNVKKSLHDKKDLMGVPMHTLLTTYMRVGNETYYKAHGHKGLTTLTKKDVAIKPPTVTFNYIGKDGVPIDINKKYSNIYIQRLKPLLKKPNKFVFSKNGGLIRENDFKEAFMRYCGHEFYPHIVRSHYATTKVKNFLKNKKKTTKQEVTQLFTQIAHDLGHKKFNKKKHQWQEHITVTINSYIQPELITKIQKITK